jgi:isoprenylcysteine carboxyl methyltransferase (ICMT) family protein YpbQ
VLNVTTHNVRQVVNNDWEGFRMSRSLVIIVAVIAAFRIWTLYVASTNEKRLKAQGAKEYGLGSTLAIWIATGAVYGGSVIEGDVYRHAQFDGIAAIGLAIYIFSALALIWVIRTLGPFWSGKVLIAPGHQLVVHPIFRAIKHPNYFLNMIPELVGFSIMLHAWITLAIGLPIFLVTLYFRIRVEEWALKGKFEAY